MSWSESWHRAQQGRVQRSLAAVIGHVVVAALLCAGNVWIVTEIVAKAGAQHRTQAVGLALTLTIPLVGILVSGIAAGRRYRRERSVLRLVPERDGLICPRCHRPLHAVDGGRARCVGCDRELPVTVIRDEWEQHPHGGRRRSRPGRPPESRSRAVLWSLRNRPWVGTIAGIVLWLLVVAIWSLRHGEPMLLAAVRLSPLLFLVTAFVVLAAGVKRRAGTSLHCARCDYEVAAGGIGPACPECGQSWAEPGARVRGRVVRSPLLASVGVCLFLLAAVGLLSSDGFRASLTPTGLLLAQIEHAQATGRSSIDTWPILAARTLDRDQSERLTWMLIEEIVEAPRGFVTAEWALLRGSTLSREQERALIEGLLEKRDRLGFLSAEDRRWIEASIRSGTVPEPLVRRYRSP